MGDKQVSIDGFVDPQFASIRKLFARDQTNLAERNTQLCVYVEGEKVVDLWGTAVGDEDFHADSLVNIFSSGKSLEAIALASLVDKGLLSYEDKIVLHWPEFGQQGKDQLRIADLMRHEAGLASLNVSIDPQNLLRENIKQNCIGSVIESHPQKFRSGENNQREYHAISRGWIVNELFRRVDPKSRTIGEFLEQEISQPLGADINIGLHESKLKDRSPVHLLPIGYHLQQSLKPIFLGRAVRDNALQTSAKLLPLLPRMLPRVLPRVLPTMFPGAQQQTNPGSAMPFKGMNGIGFFNHAIVAQGETPSANAHCSARGLAKVAAMMANRGSFENHTYLSDTAWQRLHDEPTRRRMAFTTTFTQGGVAEFGDSRRGSSRLERAANTGREGFYGWMGLGGSVFQWHPEKKIGFAYVPTSLHAVDVVNERGKAYQRAVQLCLRAQGR